MSNEKPKSNGWYEVTDSDGDVSVIFIHVLPDGSLVWGWHENDDPEALRDGASFRKLTDEEVTIWKQNTDLNF